MIKERIERLEKNVEWLNLLFFLLVGGLGLWMFFHKNQIKKQIIVKKLAGAKPIIVKFYSSDKCGYCTQFQPMWEEIQKRYPNNDYEKVNCTNGCQNVKLMYNKKIMGYPSFTVKINDEEYLVKDDNFNRNSLEDWKELFKEIESHSFNGTLNNH